jgi:uncharacterized protein
MPMSRNVEAVRAAYQAFTDGDLHRFIGSLAADWRETKSAAVPWRGTYRGHDGVREMFAKVAERAETTYEPSEFIEGDDRIVPRSTGGPATVRELQDRGSLGAKNVW